MNMTMRELWSLTADPNALAPQIEVSSIGTAQVYFDELRKRRDRAIRNLLVGRPWDARDS